MRSGFLSERGVKADTSLMSRSGAVSASRSKKDPRRARAGPPGREAPSTALWRKPSAARRSFAARLHRRDLDQDQHDPPLRRAITWPTARRQGPARPLEDRRRSSPLCPHDRIEAPCLFDRTHQRRRRFLAYVEQFPRSDPQAATTSSCSTTSDRTKERQVRQAIKAAGARLLFLPKYSPISIRSSRCSRQAESPGAKGPPRHAPPRRRSPTPSRNQRSHGHFSPQECAELSEELRICRKPKCRTL